MSSGAKEQATNNKKKSYSAPELKEYGSVKELTQSGGTTKPEIGVPNTRA